MKPNLIGITGKAGAGKDTVADILIKAGRRYKYSFATPLKTMLCSIGINPHNAKEDPHPDFGVSPRRMMQTLGTEWGRNLIHPDLWVIIARQRYTIAGPGMVISDVRFENEAAFIREHGVLIHVHRNELPSVHSHVSENGVSAMLHDINIYNNGSLADLEVAVGRIFSS